MADGNGGNNYSVSYVGSTAGVITPALLTVTAQADSRVYDGTTASSAAPVVSGATYDTVGTAATQSFDNRNAGTGKSLTASGLVMADGNGGNNYSVSYIGSTAGRDHAGAADGDRAGGQPRVRRHHGLERGTGGEWRDLRYGRHRGHARVSTTATPARARASPPQAS